MRFGALKTQNSHLLFDGGLATELERRGADLRDELWSARLLLDEPSLVRAVHEAYLLAGADVITTASYQASYEGFARRGLGDAASDALFARSVELAREAVARAGRHALVAASLGPHGATLADGSEYRGDTSLDEAALREFHRPRFEALRRAKPDFVLFETVPSLREVRAIVALTREYPDVPVMIDCSATSPHAIAHGEPFDAVLDAVTMLPSRVAVGVNCAAPVHVQALLESVRARAGETALAAMPNNGDRWDALTRRWVGQRSFDAGAFVFAATALGARIVGGCCRTTPAHTRAMRRALDEVVEGAAPTR